MKDCSQSTNLSDHKFVFLKEPKMYLIPGKVIKDIAECTVCGAGVSSEDEEIFRKKIKELNLNVPIQGEE